MNRRVFIGILAALPLAPLAPTTTDGGFDPGVLSIEEMRVMRDSAEQFAEIFARPIPSVFS